MTIPFSNIVSTLSNDPFFFTAQSFENNYGYIDTLGGHLTSIHESGLFSDFFHQFLASISKIIKFRDASIFISFYNIFIYLCANFHACIKN